MNTSDWWRDLARDFNMQLLNWDGMPPASGAWWRSEDGQDSFYVPGILAQAMYDKLNVLRADIQDLSLSLHQAAMQRNTK